MSVGAFLIKQLEILKRGCRFYTAALFNVIRSSR